MQDKTHDHPSPVRAASTPEGTDAETTPWCPDDEATETTDSSRAAMLTGSPALVRPCDVKGVLHSHSQYGDGVHPLDTMVDIAREIGLEYLGVSDHFRSVHHIDGLDVNAIAAQRQEIERLNEQFPDFDILQGVELDANLDGSLPLDDATLMLFDYVLVSLQECTDCSQEDLTARALKVIEHPLVTIMARPLNDFMLRKPPVPMDMETVLAAAARTGTAVEIDANPLSPELDWTHCHLAQHLGVSLVISPNAHRAARIVDYRHGAQLARNAGICCRSLLNTLSSPDLRTYIRAKR